jgi:ubiquinone/menaquinone biosynthesis C-methylase UbiE
MQPSGRFVAPSVVATHFHIRPGETVADYGAGTGYFVPELAAAVGREGRVYAVEIQKNLVETLGTLVRERHFDQVQVLWGDLETPQGTKIPAESVDVGIMVNILFQLEDKTGALAEIDRTLRSGARLFVIDWSESFGGLGPQPGDVVTKESARAIVESMGYVLDREFPSGDHHYGLQFRKP